MLITNDQFPVIFKSDFPCYDWPIEKNRQAPTEQEALRERRNDMKKTLNNGMCMYMMRMLYSRASQSVWCMACLSYTL